jgi:uncharacterized membrane protein YcaP (DUF421 family)
MEEISSALDAVLGLSASKAEQLGTAQVCARAIVVYIILIGFVRLGKKRFLGQATAFDVILLIMLGSISSRAISGTAPFVASLGATLILILFHWVISYFAEFSPALGYMTKGSDTLLIKEGRVSREALKSAHMSDDDLAEDLRQRGVEKMSQVKEARLERSGKLSVIKSDATTNTFDPSRLNEHGQV